MSELHVLGFIKPSLKSNAISKSMLGNARIELCPTLIGQVGYLAWNIGSNWLADVPFCELTVEGD
eukprot:1148169-Pelagomonas_calceolata.AAC.2